MFYSTDHYSKSDMNKFQQVAEMMNVDLDTILTLAESRSSFRVNMGEILHDMKDFGLRVSVKRFYKVTSVREFSFNSKGIKWIIAGMWNGLTGETIVTLQAETKYRIMRGEVKFNKRDEYDKNIVKLFINRVLKNIND